MQGYLNKGKELLKLLFNNGFESYFIGETVRNSLLGVDSDVIEIITSASQMDIKSLLVNQIMGSSIDEFKVINEAKISFIYGGYDVLIYSYVSQSNFGTSHGPSNEHYSKKLEANVSLRDFTVNAIAMSYSGKITDCFDGVSDLNKKIIRSIGNAKNKFLNNPIYMFNAFDMISNLNFKLTNNVRQGIRKRAKYVGGLDVDTISNEMRKILDGNHAHKAINEMVRSGFHKYLPGLKLGLKRLCLYYHKVNFEELMLMSFVLNKEICEDYLSRMDNDTLFRKIYTLAMANPKCKYDELTLYANGLDVCLEAARINYLLGRTSKNMRKKVTKAYNALPMHKPCDLKFKGDDILRISDLRDAMVIGDIMDDITAKVLTRELQNTKEDIEPYVLSQLDSLGVRYDVNREAPATFEEVEEYPTENTLMDEDLSYVTEEMNDALEDDVTSHRLRILEQRLDEQDKLLREKTREIQEIEHQKVVESSQKFINSAHDLILKDPSIASVVKDKEKFEDDLYDYLVNYLERNEENE